MKTEDKSAESLPLAQLAPGESARITALEAPEATARRLRDLGLVPGTPIRALLRNPSGDPTAYRFRSVVLGLRRSDTARIRVRRLPAEASDTARIRVRRLPAEAPGPTRPAPQQAAPGCPERPPSPGGPEAGCPSPGTRRLTVALAGNPNTGKSTVFNALTGLKQHTGNWPGKTVSTMVGSCRFRGRELRIVDLPGAYSLGADSPDEEVARDFLLFGAPDLAVVVVDASALEREIDDMARLQALLTDQGWTLTTALCVMIFSVLHFPCSTTTWTIYRETKSLRWTLLANLLPTALALAVCAAVAALMRALGF